MKFEDKKVTVVVPIYNGENCIDKCVSSLLKQTYSHVEIILVNDGSDDQTPIKCLEYQKKYKNIRYIDKKNEGTAIARLEGVKKASADYISFVDADDWVEEDYITRMMDEMGDADIIAAGISKIYADEDYRVFEEKNNVLPGIYSGNDELRKLFCKMLCYAIPFKLGILPYACNKIYKKEQLVPLMLAVDKRIYDGEDVAILFPYLIQCKKIVVSDYCGYQYMIHKGSICTQKRDDAYCNASWLYTWLYDFFSKTKYKKIMLPQLRDYFLTMVWKRDPLNYIQSNQFVFPFKRVEKGSKIILYGAGNVGKAYYMQIKQSGYCEIVAWVDKNIDYVEGIDCCILRPHKVVNKNCDYIIIAIESQYVCNKVYEDYIKLGISADKIILYNERGKTT